MNGAGPARLRRAGSMMLLLYACRTAAALAISWPLSAQLIAGLAHAARAVAPERAAAVALAQLGAHNAPAITWRVLAAGGLYAALGPWLGLSWLHAMDGAGSARASLVHGLRGYPSSLMLTCCAWITGAGTILVFAIGPALLAALPFAAELAQQALRAAGVCTGALVLLYLATLHDLARAALAAGAGGPWRALARARHALGAPALLLRGLSAGAAALLLLLAEALGRSLPASRWDLPALACQQALVFATLGARGLWLAWALERRMLRRN